LAPDKLIEALTPKAAEPRQLPTQAVRSSYGDKALMAECRRVEAIQAATRNHELHGSSCKMGGLLTHDVVDELRAEYERNGQYDRQDDEHCTPYARIG
jgi:hypothetical protein